MRKLLALFLAMLMLMNVAAMAAAADEEGSTSSDGNQKQTSDVEVKYDNDNNTGGKYTVVIPPSVTVDVVGEPTVLPVEALDVVLPDGKALEVTVASFQLGENGAIQMEYLGSFIPYLLQIGTTKVTQQNQLVLSVPSGTTTGNVDMKVTITNEDIAKATKAGEHKDTLTFTFEVKDVTP